MYSQDANKINAKNTNLFSEQHYRVVKSLDGQWVVKATIALVADPNKRDIKKLTPTKPPTHTATLEFFHSRTAMYYDPVEHHRFPLQVKSFEEYIRH